MTTARHGRRRLLLATMLPMALAVADQTLLVAATPAIAAELGALRDTTWVALAYLLASTATVPLYGRLGDRQGRRRWLLVALALFGAGCALGGWAPSMGWLVTARGLQGLGGGGLMVLSQALVSESVSPRERAGLQGWFIAVFSLAGVGGMVLGSLVVHHVGWRWLFDGQLPLVALALALATALPARPGHADAPVPDVAGFALFAGASTLALVWVSFGGHRFAWGSAPGLGLALAALLAAAALAAQQRRSRQPLLPLELWALPGLGRMTALVAVNAAVMFSLSFFVPVMVQLGQGGDARLAGLALLPFLAGSVLASGLAGRLAARSARVGGLPRWGLALTALMLVLLAAWMPRMPQLELVMAGLGLGLGSLMAHAQLYVQTLAGPARLGAATALVSLARACGSTFGTALFSAAVYADLGRWQPTAAHPEGELLLAALQQAFVGLALVTALAAWAARRLPVLDLDRLPPGSRAAAPAGRA